MNTFAKRLRQAREEKGMSMEELAKSVGLTKGSIWKYEQELSKSPKVSVSKKLAEKLDVSWEWLIGEEQKGVDYELISLVKSLPDTVKEEAQKYLTYLKERG